MNQNPKVMNTPLPQRDELTAKQLSNLLYIAQALYPLLLNRDPDKDSKNGSAFEAAEATMIKVLDRVDTIIDDADRWSLNAQRTLEKQLAELYASHAELLQMQKLGVIAVSAPHTVHKPRLLKLEDGTWMAILGELSNLEHAICAAGNNPAEAMMAWDAVFTGMMQQQKFELQPEPPATTPAPRQRRKKRNGN